MRPGDVATAGPQVSVDLGVWWSMFFKTDIASRPAVAAGMSDNELGSVAGVDVDAVLAKADFQLVSDILVRHRVAPLIDLDVAIRPRCCPPPFHWFERDVRKWLEELLLIVDKFLISGVAIDPAEVSGGRESFRD